MSRLDMMEFLRRDLFRFLAQQGGSIMTKIISDEQVSFETEDIGQLLVEKTFNCPVNYIYNVKPHT